jgi:2-C-methyl-D-erythritol 4-phosphate cytidylyltransferase/2-C-methyl-D-erythritol 2,4-cyclodiphosphate synthase
MTNAAIIVAAGRGERLGAEVPKQYLPLGGHTVLYHAAATLSGHPRIGAVRTVIRPEDRERYEAAVKGLGLLEPAMGGATRQDSVRLGLESLEGQAPSNVLIHDAARPFLGADLIGRLVDSLAASPGVVAALPVADTLKRAGDGKILETVDRAGLWRAQTPQGFHFDAILKAHQGALGSANFTDDAAVAEAAGLPVALVEGDEDNFKITSAGDLARAERVLLARAGETRVGTGYDVHRLGPGDGVTLCGVRLPCDRSLHGHSDADVALHAVTDALLGTIGAGDIGSHFPPGDPEWAGAASDRFAVDALRRIKERGGHIVHVDLTIVCETPKIGPHRAAMKDRLAGILGLSEDCVSVKATTTEGLGLTGRGEGIAAQAAATVRLPIREANSS